MIKVGSKVHIELNNKAGEVIKIIRQKGLRGTFIVAIIIKFSDGSVTSYQPQTFNKIFKEKL